MEDADRKRDVYAIVTEKIISHLETGTVPWRQPWIHSGVPTNVVSRKSYRGINVWLLNAQGYARNLFLTFNQAKELGASVKKGESAHLVVFWKWVRKDEKDRRPIEELPSKELRPILRYYSVFNVEQCNGIPKEFLPELQMNNGPLLACEKVLDEMPSAPQIVHDKHQACYYPSIDTVNMPRIETFVSSEAYYCTLFHELVHSTGHATRLNRKEITEFSGFGSEDYSLEELTAEIGASYLSSHTGIVMDDLAGNAAYIQGWLKVLRNDRRFIVHASAQAQKAVEFILNDSSDQANE